jgi:urease accessory protein
VRTFISMNDPEQLITALQLGDSFFPSGAFAYSSGLETFVSDGLVCCREDLVRFIDSYLLGLVARSDLLFVKLSCSAAIRGDMDEIVRLDRLIHAMKPAKELREASMQMGRQVLQVMKGLYPSSIARSLWQRLEERKLWGHHAVVFGTVCAGVGVESEKALLTYLYAAVSSLVSAGVRLIPLGHSDGQLAIGELKPVMIRITTAVALLGESDICTFAPALEIRAMQHEHLFTRLFKS